MSSGYTEEMRTLGFPDFQWIRNVIISASRYDSSVNFAIEKMLREEERLCKDEGRVINGWEEFYKLAKEYLLRAAKELKKRKIDIEEIGWYRLRHMLKELFKEWVAYKFDASKVSSDIIVYGDNMGFILEEGEKEWKVFEGSDEPSETDIELYRKLILDKEIKRKKVVLYGVHDRNFVQSWREKGIPEGVYFAQERWMAQRYWHEGGNDVFVKVKLPVDAVVPTTKRECRTIRWVNPDEIDIMIVK
jgi:hypothetical protein